jgi:hypothetical protein
VPPAEACNGVDDDCGGRIDASVVAPGTRQSLGWAQDRIDEARPASEVRGSVRGLR